MNRPAAESLTFDELIEELKQDVDVTLLDENLRLTPEQRILKLQSFMELIEEARLAGKRMRGEA